MRQKESCTIIQPLTSKTDNNFHYISAQIVSPIKGIPQMRYREMYTSFAKGWVSYTT